MLEVARSANLGRHGGSMLRERNGRVSSSSSGLRLANRRQDLIRIRRIGVQIPRTYNSSVNPAAGDDSERYVVVQSEERKASGAVLPPLSPLSRLSLASLSPLSRLSLSFSCAHKHTVGSLARTAHTTHAAPSPPLPSLQLIQSPQMDGRDSGRPNHRRRPGVDYLFRAGASRRAGKF